MKKIEYIKVGYLYKKIANAINKPAGDICITETAIKHIYERHSVELETLGIDAVGFVKFVVSNFTHIFEDAKNKSMLLAYIPETKSAKVVIINIAVRDDKYFVKTAYPLGTKYLYNRRLIWIKK